MNSGFHACTVAPEIWKKEVDVAVDGIHYILYVLEHCVSVYVAAANQN